MNAIPRPAPTLLDIMREDMRHGAPGAYLEAPEVPQWVAEMNQSSSWGIEDMVGCLTDSVSELDGVQRDKLNALLEDLMGDVRLDHVVELRDVLRQTMTDYCTKQAEKLLELP
jgi:hypothetical protein